MFIGAKLDDDAARRGTLLIGFVYFVSVCPAPYLVERLGRRLLLMSQWIGCLLTLSILALCIQLQDEHTVFILLFIIIYFCLVDAIR